jgi:hypothetical protein
MDIKGNERKHLAMSTTTAQKMKALGNANDTRYNRSRFKATLKQMGREDAAKFLADALRESPGWLGSVYVWQAVQWVPRVGDRRAAYMLKVADIDPWRKVGRLTERQTVALTAELGKVSYNMPQPGTQPRKPGPKHCRVCGEYMPRPTTDRLCGFCVGERDEAAA